MGRKRRIGLAALLIAILGGFAWLLMHRPEPSYLGKSLSAWLAEYNHQNLNWPRSFDTPTDEAIRHIGTNAFPMIARRLRYRDSALKMNLLQFLGRHPRLHVPFLAPQNGNQYNAQGVAALCALGRDAKPLIPTLAEAMSHYGPGNRAVAGFWLESLGSDGEAAVPALIRMVQDKKDRLRAFEVETLAAVGVRQTNVVLPVLEKCLQDPYPPVRFQATNEFTREPWIEFRKTR